MPYVDGFLLAVPKRKLQMYRRIAQRAGRVWREHGALEYRECAGDDLKVKFGVSFARTAKLKAGETAVFSWIVYKSRAQRDRVNAKVMKDVRMQKLMKDPMPFDMKRMAYGGFKVRVHLWAQVHGLVFPRFRAHPERPVFLPAGGVAWGRRRNAAGSAVSSSSNPFGWSCWLADITHIATEEGWLYLAALMDLYSHRIVGWNTADRIDRFLALTALEEAL